MNTVTDQRSDPRHPDQIEHDIARKRAEVSSTIDAIQRKLTPGELMEQALQTLKTGNGRQFTENLARTARDNPMPVVLVGVGLAWLMASSARRGPDWRHELAYRAPSTRANMPAGARGASMAATSDGSSRYTAPYGNGSVGGRDATPGAMGEPRGDAMADDRSGTSDDGLGKRLVSSVTGAAGSVRSTVSGAASSARSTVSGVAHGARETVSSAARRARDLGHGVRSRAGDLGERAAHTRDTARHLIEEQPLLVGVVGLAVGATIGALLPATRREDALLGEVRDDVIEGARQTARESMRTVQESAQKVAETARSEVERVIDKTTSGSGPSARATP